MCARNSLSSDERDDVISLFRSDDLGSVTSLRVNFKTCYIKLSSSVVSDCVSVSGNIRLDVPGESGGGGNHSFVIC